MSNLPFTSSEFAEIESLKNDKENSSTTYQDIVKRRQARIHTENRNLEFDRILSETKFLEIYEHHTQLHAELRNLNATPNVNPSLVAEKTKELIECRKLFLQEAERIYIHSLKI